MEALWHRRSRLFAVLKTFLLCVTGAVDAADPPPSKSWSVKPQGELQTWVLSQTNPFFGETSRTWVETSGRFALVFDSGPVTIETGLLGMKTFGEDPYGTESAPPDFEVDQAYVRIAELGGLPVELTVGRQNLKIGTQFLFGDGVYDGFVSSTKQVAYHSPRKAFDAVRIRSSVAGFDVDGFAYRIDPSWDGAFGDDGILGGAELSRKLESIGGTYTAGGFYRASPSDGDNDMTILDFRGHQTLPEKWTPLPGFYVSGEIAAEIGTCRNPYFCDDVGSHMKEHAWHAEAGLRADSVRFRPFFEAGYVYFSRDFTQFAYGGHDWGRWYLGNQIDWLAFNTNARVVQMDVGFWPHDALQLRAQYFHTREVEPTGTSDGGTLANEWTFVAAWLPSDWLSVSLVVGYSVPGEGLEGAALVNPFAFDGSKAVAVGDEASLDLATAVIFQF